MSVSNEIQELEQDADYIIRTIKRRHLCGNKGGHEFNNRIAIRAGAMRDKARALREKLGDTIGAQRSTGRGQTVPGQGDPHADGDAGS